MATFSSRQGLEEPAPVEVMNTGGGSPVLLVCEHASNYIPARYEGLGLTAEAAQSHAAWDPGALALARELSNSLDATLVAGTVSRLVYDCNRPPESHAAVLARSELIDVPGNAGLTEFERRERIETVYYPFQSALAEAVSRTGAGKPILVTIHSFTPVYLNKHRDVEIGILHDSDSRLADAMLDAASAHREHRVERNQPYGPADGVTHTLQLHGIRNGILNVMLEVANNLLATAADQRAVAGLLTSWLREALEDLDVRQIMKDKICRA